MLSVPDFGKVSADDLELVGFFAAVDCDWFCGRRSELDFGALDVVRLVGEDEADTDGDELDVDELSVAISVGCLLAVVMLISSGGFPDLSLVLLSLELRFVFKRLVDATSGVVLGFDFVFPVGVMLIAEFGGCRLFANIVLDSRDRAEAAATTFES